MMNWQEFWNTIISRDESKFNLFSPDGRKIVWRRVNTELNSANLSNCQTCEWFCDGMGCISANDVRKLVFMDTIRDEYGYMNIQKQNLLNRAENIDLGSTVLSKWEAIWPVTNQTWVITYGCQCVHSVLAVTFLPACLRDTAWQHCNDLVGRCTKAFEGHFASHLESTVVWKHCVTFRNQILGWTVLWLFPS